MKIAFVDSIGLTYDGLTAEKFGLGGSESATIFMARELQKIGFEVTVFNSCIDSRASEGVYDGVRYVDLSRLDVPNDHVCDILIVTRSVLPFLPEQHKYKHLRDSAKLKVLLLHDTFVTGDDLVESMLVSGQIDQMFTLSDFHTNYITTCQHGPNKRNFEVLKNKIFVTRNGAIKHRDVDVAKKTRHHFVYNASVTKGMLPLIFDVWPIVKQHVPLAKLTVIGGYYRFRDGAPPDQQELMWRDIVAREDLKNLDITFTGVIPQHEIADILADAAFMVYPGAFPETFGISSLESLLYNTPIITTRFGALEETAIDLACYKIDYAIEPNSLYPNIPKNEQVQKFAKLVIDAANNQYLWQQKAHACRQVHDIATWDTVALQWKQHFYKTLSLYLPVEEYRKVTKINEKVARVFGRRNTNPCERRWESFSPQKKIVVVSPVYNAEKYIEKLIDSVATQDYDNWQLIIIDDASTDGTVAETVKAMRKYYNEHGFMDKFSHLTNFENKGSVENYFRGLDQAICEQADIIIMLDGDDSLVNDNSIFHYYNDLYDNEDIRMTYGSMWSLADNIPLIGQPYPEEVHKTRNYREYQFPWGIPYTHLRTLRSMTWKLFDTEKIRRDGKYLRAGGDTALFYGMVEALDDPKNQLYAVPHIMVNYNDLNPLNDYKVNSIEQNETAEYVRKQKNPYCHSDS